MCGKRGRSTSDAPDSHYGEVLHGLGSCRPIDVKTYDAFISYSASDGETLAAAIENGLRRVAPRRTSNRRLNVFRDSPALHAGADQALAIRTALDRSEFMVLLASPMAAVSKWVTSELEMWLEGHSVSRLLLVLVHGIIEWDTAVGDFDWHRTNALPHVLSRRFDAQPLHVDLRHVPRESASLNHPEFRHAMVSLAARITERPEEDVRFREPIARRIRSWLGTPLLVVADGLSIIAGAVSITGDVATLAYSELAHWLRTAAPWRNLLRRRESGPHLPPDVIVDDVHFTLTAPVRLQPNTSAEIIFWCHLSSEHAAVLQRALLILGRRRHELALKSEGPVEVARGTILAVRLSIEGVSVKPSAKTILWKGRTGNATFVIVTPPDCVLGERKGTASICVDDLEIARLDFVLIVSRSRTIRRRRSHQSVVRHQTAFASYAHEDRAEVLKRVQGMNKAAPSLDVFVDVLKLRSGQYWEQEIRNRIPQSDIFYLFWSRHASGSKWVDTEWRLAYAEKGLDFIDPVPLEPSTVAPEPPELAKRHFDDPLMPHIVQDVRSGP